MQIKRWKEWRKEKEEIFTLVEVHTQVFSIGWEDPWALM
jgi:hypothetical protein